MVNIIKFSNHYKRIVADTVRIVTAARPIVLSNTTNLALQQFQQRLQPQIELLLPNDDVVFRYQAAPVDEERPRVLLWRKLSDARDVESVLLSDASLDKACSVYLRDLRRLVTGNWLNDETLNALLVIFTHDAAQPIDAFTSFISDELRDLQSNKIDDKRFLTRYYSFGGNMFQSLLRDKVPILTAWNSPSHWSLLVIDTAANRIKHIDSLNNSVVPNSELAQRLCTSLGMSNEIRLVRSRQQQDTDNCGVFVALNAWKISQQRALEDAPHVVGDGVALRRVLARCITHNSSAPMMNTSI